MYKRLPCRNFDPLSGMPRGACKEGDKCRFIHPDDPNWRDSRREHPYIPKAPLAAQSYAFRRYQREISSSPGRYRDGRLAKEMARPSKPSNRDPLRRREASRSEHKRTTNLRRDVQQKDVQQKDVQQKDVEQKDVQEQKKENIKVEELHVNQKERLQKADDAGITKKDRYMNHLDLNPKSSGEVWNAFMQIARLTRESDILKEQQEKEASKIVTYTAVEKTLNEISNQMGLAVIPHIDQSTLIQQDCGKTIAENNETVNKLCKEVVQVFVADVTKAVDKQLQTALQNIRNEAVDLSEEIRNRNSRSAGPSSRWEGRAHAGGSWSSQDYDKGAYRTKKRRMHTPSPYSRRSASKEKLSMSSEIMKDLEAKLERQAQALINLAQENEKLRAQNRLLSTNSPAP